MKLVPVMPAFVLFNIKENEHGEEETDFVGAFDTEEAADYHKTQLSNQGIEGELQINKNSIFGLRD